MYSYNIFSFILITTPDYCFVWVLSEFGPSLVQSREGSSLGPGLTSAFLGLEDVCSWCCGLSSVCGRGPLDTGCSRYRSVCVLVAQTCPTLCNPMDCSTPGSCVHGILQARILHWVAIPFSRGYSRPRIEPGSPALQADSLPSESQGKLWII